MVVTAISVGVPRCAKDPVKMLGEARPFYTSCLELQMKEYPNFTKSSVKFSFTKA